MCRQKEQVYEARHLTKAEYSQAYFRTRPWDGADGATPEVFGYWVLHGVSLPGKHEELLNGVLRVWVTQMKKFLFVVNSVDQVTWK